MLTLHIFQPQDDPGALKAEDIEIVSNSDSSIDGLEDGQNFVSEEALGCKMVPSLSAAL